MMSDSTRDLFGGTDVWSLIGEAPCYGHTVFVWHDERLNVYGWSLGVSVPPMRQQRTYRGVLQAAQAGADFVRYILTTQQGA